MTKLERLAAARAARTRVVHLYRGAPVVRSWSKYQTTVRNRTLCGIPIKTRRNQAETDTSASDDVTGVNCPYCHQLLN